MARTGLRRSRESCSPDLCEGVEAAKIDDRHRVEHGKPERDALAHYRIDAARIGDAARDEVERLPIEGGVEADADEARNVPSEPHRNPLPAPEEFLNLVEDCRRGSRSAYDFDERDEIGWVPEVGDYEALGRRKVGRQREDVESRRRARHQRRRRRRSTDRGISLAFGADILGDRLEYKISVGERAIEVGRRLDPSLCVDRGLLVDQARRRHEIEGAHDGCTSRAKRRVAPAYQGGI